MAETLLNNYSDDANIKRYISEKLAPMVFHDIPLNVLNTGMFSLINEYISQTTEQLAFTSSFYFNESFITKAVLPDSIYAEAAIFNIGYAFATPSCTQILLELRLEDLYKNSVKNSEGLMEFVLDKNTKFNLSNGNVYSLDYDILVQYIDVKTSSRTSTIPAWNVQYIDMEGNCISVNKNTYIPYRVTDKWLCLFVNVSEFERNRYYITNNMTNMIANDDFIITCGNHICGFDIKYIRADGSYEWLKQDHIVPIHGTVNDKEPYVHYIMDNPQTIRLMFQLQGTNYFRPELNSSYEIIVYTCHGKSANFTKYDEEDQPNVLTSANRYTNNGNVLKAAFVIGASMGGTDIGNTETIRRKTIEAYNTANVLSTDHDIEEWLKTFYFENVLYPFFFKRRDDPWGRLWSGYLALKDSDDYIFRTNTLHGRISYDILSNNDNATTSNEMIIPPGWLWKYEQGSRYRVIPIVDGKKIATAKTIAKINEPYVFSNPFGIRIQKAPFAIGYFNPWINQYVTVSKLDNTNPLQYSTDDVTSIYHATPMYVHIERTYLNNYYKLSTWIDPTIHGMLDGTQLVTHFKQSAVEPVVSEIVWNYFKKPLNMLASIIPFTFLNNDDDVILPFDPNKTFLCVQEITKFIDEETSEVKYNLLNLRIVDERDSINPITYPISIVGEIDEIYGLDTVWGNPDNYIIIESSGENKITYNESLENGVSNIKSVNVVDFDRVESREYYTMRIKNDTSIEMDNTITKIKITKAVIKTHYASITEKTRTDSETMTLWKVNKGGDITSISITYHWTKDGDETTFGHFTVSYYINNAKDVYIPYPSDKNCVRDNGNGMYIFEIENEDGELEPDQILVFADMRTESANSHTIIDYKLPFYKIIGIPAFYVKQHSLPYENNNMRVILRARLNGSETGYVEMTPVKIDSDGTYLFETEMYPLNELIDSDNRIHVASIESGNGDWVPTLHSSNVSIDAMNPDLQIGIMIKSVDKTLQSPIKIGDTFTGYRMIDEYRLDEFKLIQELKEMRSVVNFGSPIEPSSDIIIEYNNFMYQMDDSTSRHGDFQTLYCLYLFALQQSHSMQPLTSSDISEMKYLCDTVSQYIDNTSTIINNLKSTNTDIQNLYNMLLMFGHSPSIQVQTREDIHDCYYDSTTNLMFEDSGHNTLTPATEGGLYCDLISQTYYTFQDSRYQTCDIIVWEQVVSILGGYVDLMNEIFDTYNVRSGVEIQQIPFVEYSLMNSKRFPSFVSTFLNVHKALEPVIFKRLEGNHYLDCKLLATYGLPHSYTSDAFLTYDTDAITWWPDLNIQMEFDVKLYNNAISINTINELKLIIKAYFNRLTSLHTASDLYSINNNIYISHIIQQMEEHSNVAYLKFKGWYTDQQNVVNGHYMDATHQAIVQRWERLEDMPRQELERYVPEMFTLEDNNIVINIIK